MSHKFFFELQIYKKISPKCVWLSYLFPFHKRFAKTGEFRLSKAGPCLKFQEVKWLRIFGIGFGDLTLRVRTKLQ